MRMRLASVVALAALSVLNLDNVAFPHVRLCLSSGSSTESNDSEGIKQKYTVNPADGSSSGSGDETDGVKGGEEELPEISEEEHKLAAEKKLREEQLINKNEAIFKRWLNQSKITETELLSQMAKEPKSAYIANILASNPKTVNDFIKEIKDGDKLELAGYKGATIDPHLTAISDEVSEWDTQIGSNPLDMRPAKIPNDAVKRFEYTLYVLEEAGETGANVVNHMKELPDSTKKFIGKRLALSQNFDDGEIINKLVDSVYRYIVNNRKSTNDDVLKAFENLKLAMNIPSGKVLGPHTFDVIMAHKLSNQQKIKFIQDTLHWALRNSPHVAASAKLIEPVTFGILGPYAKIPGDRSLSKTLGALHEVVKAQNHVIDDLNIDNMPSQRSILSNVVGDRCISEHRPGMFSKHWGKLLFVVVIVAIGTFLFSTGDKIREKRKRERKLLGEVVEAHETSFMKTQKSNQDAGVASMEAYGDFELESNSQPGDLEIVPFQM